MEKGFKTPFSRKYIKQIMNKNHPKMSKRHHSHLGKVQGNNLYNVGDVREITYIGTTLTKVKE